MSLQETISKFKQLPQNIQQALSSDEAMAKMEALEGKHNLKLASFVLRAAVKEFPFEDLGIVIRKELNLKPEQAGILKDELLDQIFAPVVNYYAEPSFAEASAGKSAKKSEGRGQDEGVKASPMMPPRPPMMTPRPQVAPPRPQPISSSADVQDDKREKRDEKGEKGLDISNQAPSKLRATGFPGLAEAKLRAGRLQASPPPPQPPKSRSYFYFDAEDEKDVEKFKKHEAVASGRGKEFIERIDKTADEVINHSLVNFSDENGKRRLKSYLTAYFRGIRDILQTKESLAKPFATGGMEFNAVTIEKIMALAKEEFRKIHSVSAESAEKAAEDAEKKEELRIKNQESRMKNEESEKVSTVAQEQKVIGHQSSVISPPTIRRERPQVLDTGRPKVSEVKPPAKLTGPIDEIEQMDLNDLRRFAQNHQGFIDRMKERLKILEDESFEKRVTGIAAWRRSFLYQQYLSIIQDSLERNTRIPEMLGGNNESQSRNMSLREWETVNRLNWELKS